MGLDAVPPQKSLEESRLPVRGIGVLLLFDRCCLLDLSATRVVGQNLPQPSANAVHPELTLQN